MPRPNPERRHSFILKTAHILSAAHERGGRPLTKPATATHALYCLLCFVTLRASPSADLLEIERLSHKNCLAIEELTYLAREDLSRTKNDLWCLLSK